MDRIDFVCQFMLRDPNVHGVVGCTISKFGAFPSIATCIKQCRGEPDAYDRRKESETIKRMRPKCEHLDLFTEKCTETDCATYATGAICPVLNGGECKLFAKRTMPCTTCGDKGA